MVMLERKDKDTNTDRIYIIDIGPTVLGEYCLIRGYGRAGSYTRFLTPLDFPDRISARAAMKDLIRRRLRRGYRPKLIA